MDLQCLRPPAFLPGRGSADIGGAAAPLHNHEKQILPIPGHKRPDRNPELRKEQYRGPEALGVRDRQPLHLQGHRLRKHRLSCLLGVSGRAPASPLPRDLKGV